MILCKACNGVRVNDATACTHCGVYMTVSQRGAASMELETRQFFENVLLEIQVARKTYATNSGLVAAIGKYCGAFSQLPEHETPLFSAVQLAALCARLFVEGDPAYSSTLKGADTQLDDLEKLIGANDARRRDPD